ncbi:MAG: glycosyltransferase [Gammaproteobacteria bacterium]|nr:glycosyltransferase [Gammaproteobacteria bacterium]
MASIRISLLTTIFKGSNVAWLHECLESVYCQREFLDEVVMVADGDLNSELEKAILQWQKKWNIKLVRLEKNYGPGGASQFGLLQCTSEWVARLDSDDIATPDRFQKQVKFLQENPDIDVLGGYMPEFQYSMEYNLAVNYVPLEHKNIAHRLSLRSPLVNSSSLFRVQKALKAGGYKQLMSHEDHLLWMAMLKNNAKFANIPYLVGFYRASPEYYKRRRGLQVIKTELNFQKIALKNGYITRYQFWRNLIFRIPPRLLPAPLLEKFYNLFLRKVVTRKDLFYDRI